VAIRRRRADHGQTGQAAPHAAVPRELRRLRRPASRRPLVYWDQSVPTERGPKPYPDWLVTELAAVDTELGIVKTGKEADVFLVRRAVPQTDRSCLLAAKRYRSAEHRMFHRDSGYLEGRRTRESRVNRAMSSRSAFGRQAIAGQWAAAEFSALGRLYAAGVPVPYPAQVLDTELLLEFIGSADGIAAPRLAEPGQSLPNWPGCGISLCRRSSRWPGTAWPTRPVRVQPAGLRRAAGHDRPAAGGRRHRQPAGSFFLTRDAENISRWFTARGLAGVRPEPGELAALLRREAQLDR